MKILVCMKQVPQKDAPLKLNESGQWIATTFPTKSTSPTPTRSKKLFAKKKARWRGRRHHLRTSPRPASTARGSGQGRRRAIHLEDDAFAGLDALNTARAIAPPFKTNNSTSSSPGCNRHYGFAQTGVILAELLGWPTPRSSCTSKSPIPASASSANSKPDFPVRKHAAARRAHDPSGINKLRYATLIGIKQAKNSPCERSLSRRYKAP